MVTIGVEAAGELISFGEAKDWSTQPSMEYKILTAVGEETPNGNTAFIRLTEQVEAHLKEGWKLAGGLTSCAVVGPRTRGSERDNWFVRVSQAVIKG